VKSEEALAARNNDLLAKRKVKSTTPSWQRSCVGGIGVQVVAAIYEAEVSVIDLLEFHYKRCWFT